MIAREVKSKKFKILPTPKNLKTKKRVTTVATIKPFLVLPKTNEKIKRKNKKVSMKKVKIIKLLLGGKK